MEHLRELRDRLIKSAIILVLTTALSFLFVEQEIGILV
jgi:hypothetical protein